MFHSVCGDRITLYNNSKTAKRNLSEFNHGLVFSSEPLKSNHLFEVRIEKKVSPFNAFISFISLQYVNKCLKCCRFMHGVAD